MPFSLQDLNNLKGLPVKAIVPAEGRPYVRFDLVDAEERAASQCRARCS